MMLVLWRWRLGYWDFQAFRAGFKYLPLIILAALATVTAADTNTLPTITYSTNRVTNVLSILSTLPVPGACLECGAPNHHMAQVRLLSAYDVVYLTATSPGHSNAMRIATGSATNWVATNLIPRTVQPYTSPGAWPTSVPPLKP